MSELERIGRSACPLSCTHAGWRMETVEMNDPFAERLAAVRQRFIARLDGRIDIIASATQQADWENELGTLELAHREAHGLCGVGQTLGFVGTGKVARTIEQ